MFPRIKQHTAAEVCRLRIITPVNITPCYVRTFSRIWGTRKHTGSGPCTTLRPPSVVRSFEAIAGPSLKHASATVENDVGVIKFNRPNNANALNHGAMEDLLRAFRWAMDESEVKVVVFSGEGKFFSAGLDLQAVPKSGPVLPDDSVETLRQIHKTLITAPKVIIAAVNGPAIGWGATSMALCDLVYTVPDAIFSTPFVKLAINVEACASITFVRALGRQKASSLILNGDRMTAQELESAGLITKILPKEGFMEEVMKMAKRLATQSNGSLELNKKLMMDPLREELLAANERECQGLKERGKTAEPREAIRAFEREENERRSGKKSAKLRL